MSQLKVKCPSCDQVVIWHAQSEFKPFCSDRCRLIDLGEWASDNRIIPSDADHDDVTAQDLDEFYEYK